MARMEVGLEKDGPVLCCAQEPQLRDVLQRLPVADHGVIERTSGQGSWVRFHAYVVVRAVLQLVVKVLSLIWVPNLLPLARGQRDRGVAHGVQGVHKGHLQQHGPEEVGPEVRGGGYQQAAAAGTPRGQEPRLRDVQLHQRLRGFNKVQKAVLHRKVPAFLVPGAAELAAAADVRQCIDHAPVQQAQAVPVEVRVRAGAVGAVAGEEHREGAAREALRMDVSPVYQRDWNGSSRSLNSFGSVQAGIEVGNRLLPHQPVLLRPHVVSVGHSRQGE
mmetsp:Transcript_52357/g.152182  ORF Transcript_52357/g.152182 Transcript_52357/m.152182 type:complete len:274 (-) Transcript_52357:208-1029(-)